MKKMWVVLMLACSGFTALAQQAKGGQTLMQIKPVPKTEQASVLAPVKPKLAILGQPASFGGYFMDFLKAERKRSMFDLTAPLDPLLDLENVLFYPNSEQVQGIALFSIKF